MSARGAQSERELDRNGPVRVIRPVIDRQNESVASAPPSFDEYFSFDAIVTALAKWRVRVMARRSDAEFYASHFKQEKDPAFLIPCAVSEYLPSRNKWARPPRRSRFSSASGLAIASIKRTVYGYRDRGTLGGTTWGRKLLALVADVQRRVADGDFGLKPPHLMFRQKDADTYRLLACYDDIVDKLLLKGAADYLRTVFDPLLDDRCYSFRVSRDKGNVQAVDELDADRRVQDGDPNLFYVRFCDDMIIVHPERKKCATAMARYLDEVAKRKLPIHDPKPNGFVYGRDYYDVKTKAPFEWKECGKGADNAAPWVGFLGNQIDYAGAVRIR